MGTMPITIEVDAETAKAYASASATDRMRIQMLLSLRLRELVNRPARPLPEVMDDMGAEAAANGLTPEVLESILRDDGE